MRKITQLFLLLFVSCQLMAQQPFNNPPKGAYLNPVFSGDYADPSILRDGKDFYIVHSSFEYYPGLQIWHSTDLIHWQIDPIPVLAPPKEDAHSISLGIQQSLEKSQFRSLRCRLFRQ